MFYQPAQIAIASHLSRHTSPARHARRIFVFMMIVSLFPVGLLTKGQAQATTGCLDRAFDRDGKVTTNFSGSSARAIALQPDGKLVVAGGSTHMAMAMARYNTDGSLDASFGTNGKVVRSDASGASAVAVLPDGKIVAAGGTFRLHYEDANGIHHYDYDFTLVRFNSDGSPDDGEAHDSTPGDSFGSGGKAMVEVPGSGSGATGMGIQPDGKIVVAGARELGITPTYDFVLARFDSDGNPDPSFGSHGLLIADLFGDYDYANAVAIQPDGKIVAAGLAVSTESVGRVYGAVLARYNSDGSPDDGEAHDSTPGDSFGSGGKVKEGSGEAQALVIQPDSKIVAASRIGFGVSRYNADGSLDAGFGTGGRVSTVFPSDGYGTSTRAVALQPDGKIVAAGITDNNHGDFALARYNSDGSSDDGTAADSTPADSFGDGGKVTTDFAKNSNDAAEAMLIQPDGKIVLAGRTQKNPASYVSDLALARYPGDATCVLPPLHSITLTSSIIPGSLNVTATVMLGAPAPPEGRVVMLSSTNEAAIVPASITIPAGKSSQQFTVRTKSVTTTRSLNIIARFGSTIRSAQLVVQPVALYSVSAGPGWVQGPANIRGSVLLNAPAPAGGLIVQLSSRNPAIAYPTTNSVKVPAGANYRTFNIRVEAVTSERRAIITATANGVTKSTFLTVAN
jgi:uncharacterized delta-60 repeat protein